MALSYDSGRKRLYVIIGIGACCMLLAVVLWRSGRPNISAGSEQDRIDAAARIAAERPMGARAALSSAVEDESPRVRIAALVQLTQIMTPEDRPVIEKAVRDEDSGVRAVAAESLGQFNDAEAAEVLKAIAASPQEDKSVRKAALRGLVPCDDPQAIVAMIELASDETAPNDIRYQAAKSAMRKAGGVLRSDRRPENLDLWRDLIQRLKNDQRIRRAYRSAGVQIVDHPEHLVGRNLHGRRELPTGSAPDPIETGRLVEKKESDGDEE